MLVPDLRRVGWSYFHYTTKGLVYTLNFLFWTRVNLHDHNFFTGNVTAVLPEGLDRNYHTYGPPVETTSIENALRESGCEALCYLIKMDCEKGEWDILPNLSAEVASKTMIVLGEWHERDYRRIVSGGKPGLDWRHIITESDKCFPHLHAATHIGWGGGLFWALPKNENDYFAEYLSLNSGNIFAANQVAEMQTKLDKANDKIKELEKRCADHGKALNGPGSALRRIKKFFAAPRLDN